MYASRRKPLRAQRDKYLEQKGNAGRRGIPFLLTFEEWRKIWQDSGRWDQRGCGLGKYVMARRGDRGAYEAGNVDIIPWLDNVRVTIKPKRPPNPESIEVKKPWLDLGISRMTWYRRKKSVTEKQNARS